jgi:hypothetical protein
VFEPFVNVLLPMTQEAVDQRRASL